MPDDLALADPLRSRRRGGRRPARRAPGCAARRPLRRWSSSSPGDTPRLPPDRRTTAPGRPRGSRSATTGPLVRPLPLRGGRRRSPRGRVVPAAAARAPSRAGRAGRHPAARGRRVQPPRAARRARRDRDPGGGLARGRSGRGDAARRRHAGGPRRALIAPTGAAPAPTRRPAPHPRRRPRRRTRAARRRRTRAAPADRSSERPSRTTESTGTVACTRASSGARIRCREAAHPVSARAA